MFALAHSRGNNDRSKSPSNRSRSPSASSRGAASRSRRLAERRQAGERVGAQPCTGAAPDSRQVRANNTIRQRPSTLAKSSTDGMAVHWPGQRRESNDSEVPPEPRTSHSHSRRQNLDRSSTSSLASAVSADPRLEAARAAGSGRFNLRQAESDNEGREGRPRSRRNRGAKVSGPVTVGAGASRKPGTNAKLLTTWVRIWPSGDSSLLQTEKSTLINQLGIQARDFRIIESLTTRQTGCILCREKCMIVNMTYIRCVITSRYILMIPPEDDRSAIFLGRLKERIRALGRPLPVPLDGNSPAPAVVGNAAAAAEGPRLSHQALQSAQHLQPEQAPAPVRHPSPQQDQELLREANEEQRHSQTISSLFVPTRSQLSLKNLATTSTASGSAMSLVIPAARVKATTGLASSPAPTEPMPAQHALANDDEDGDQGIDMPFELKALEICLDELANDVEQVARELEHSLKPAIDGLASSVRTETLDLLRRLKTRLVNIKSTAHTVRDALEELLDDDDDMFNLSLSAKEQREMDLLQRVSFAISENSEEGNLSDDNHSSDYAVEVSQVEMLLEAYFLLFDNIFDRLQDLMENVTDTEAVVNIKLDAQQNRLIAVNLVSQGLSVINYFAIGVLGFFTMNLSPNYPLSAYWGGGGSVPPGAAGPDLPHFLMILLPSILGAYSIFVFLLVFLYMRGILRF